MKVIGFRSNIGAGRMMDGETEEQFCKECRVFLRLSEGNIVEGNDMTVTSYDNETGMATVMFERPMMQSTAETLLDEDDLFLFGDFDGE